MGVHFCFFAFHVVAKVVALSDRINFFVGIGATIVQKYRHTYRHHHGPPAQTHNHITPIRGVGVFVFFLINQSNNY
jgi:hypothetical protein